MKIRKYASVLISPHQDDAYLGLGFSFQKIPHSKYIIYATKSLWPSCRSYSTRIWETIRECALLKATSLYLPPTEESLFSPPYDPENYIGDSFVTSTTLTLRSELLKIESYFDKLYLYFPSEADAAGHVVHNFTRLVAQQAIPSLSPKWHLSSYSVYAEPLTARLYRCPSTLKMANFQRLFPSQWAVIKNDPWSLAQITKHCQFEYITNEVIA